MRKECIRKKCSKKMKRKLSYLKLSSIKFNIISTWCPTKSLNCDLQFPFTVKKLLITYCGKVLLKITLLFL